MPVSSLRTMSLDREKRRRFSRASAREPEGPADDANDPVDIVQGNFVALENVFALRELS